MNNADMFLGQIPFKYISLVTLAVQNSLLVLVMRYSRTQGGPQYYSTTAVLISEIIKILICIYPVIRDHLKENKQQFNLRLLLQELARDSWKIMIPAGLYTLQNNLQYVAVTLLDAATFQVTYQLKILTTALCAMILLQTQISARKWGSLFLLTVGIMLVQLPHNHTIETEATLAIDSERALGFLAVAIACVLSGLAGVYFEKTLKGSKSSIFVRNTQMSFFSLFPALILGVWFTDGQGIAENGFFYGYNKWVWGAILCQAFGGILVAYVVKYADNILKGFATSISILLSCIASTVFFDFVFTTHFVIGAGLVLCATYLYSLPEGDPLVVSVTPSSNGAAQTLPTSQENSDSKLIDLVVIPNGEKNEKD
eukprot:TRINITY_DN4111_c0_g1_i1.p1 TRINITY_DN4111_c0_g1~~TRINITY_DN4111_c0_g1_i1.p1  ORF type:complete len:394 (+),score=54.63 TRINITY_DN4111_c0_g1_i1:78-1184(+)